jgi:Mg2+-importing ATPase
VIKGRETFGNILKYLNMTASSNFGNVFSVLVASAWLPWAPMLAMQMLIQNLVYDVSQMLLPWDKMDPEFLKLPRRVGGEQHQALHAVARPDLVGVRHQHLLPDVVRVRRRRSLCHRQRQHGSAGQRSGHHELRLVHRGAGVADLVVHMLRTRKIPFLQSTATLPVLLYCSIAIAIGCYLPFSPLTCFGCITLDGPKYFMWLVITMLAYMGLTQTVKSIYIKRHGQWF